MNKITELGIIMIAVASIAVADVVVKKITDTSYNLSEAFHNPLMFVAIALYLLQLVLYTYVFINEAALGIVGIVQTALYAIIVIGCGVFFFKETITARQGFGMALATMGVIILNMT